MTPGHRWPWPTVWAAVGGLATLAATCWLIFHHDRVAPSPDPRTNVSATVATPKSHGRLHYRTGQIDGLVHGLAARSQVWLAYRKPAQVELIFASRRCLVVHDTFHCPGVRLGARSSRRRHFVLVLVVVSPVAQALLEQSALICGVTIPQSLPPKATEILHIPVQRL
jgi:hypothetical protein